MKKIVQHNNNSKCRDPFICKHNGKYYHCFTEDSLSVSVACADTLDGLENADAKLIFSPEENTEYSKEVWAPELHITDGKCYVYVACDDGQNCNHRMYVLTNNCDDPMKGEYVMLGKISDGSDRWAIDGTILKHGCKTYFVWSGWEENINISQKLYIAEMSDPCTLSGERVMISEPEYDWEKLGSRGVVGSPYINEGPFAVYNGGDTYIAYSASGSWCVNYCVAMLKLVGDNPLDKECWKKLPEPIFSANEKVKGAGHCSVIEESGKYSVFFHAWDSEETNISWKNVSLWQGELRFEKDGISIV